MYVNALPKSNYQPCLCSLGAKWKFGEESKIVKAHHGTEIYMYEGTAQVELQNVSFVLIVIISLSKWHNGPMYQLFWIFVHV
jgi:hypothetical protein